MRTQLIFWFGLDDLVVGKGLEDAQLVAWRYLLVDKRQVRQAAEILPDARAGGSKFGALTSGHSAAVEEAFRLIEQLPEVQQRTYEIRALRVPALYLMALWLKDVQDGSDHFFVLPPAFAPVLPLHDYSAADLHSLLQDLARQKAPKEQKVTPSLSALPNR